MRDSANPSIRPRSQSSSTCFPSSSNLRFLWLAIFGFALAVGKKDEWPEHSSRYSPIVNPPKQAASTVKCAGFMLLPFSFFFLLFVFVFFQLKDEHLFYYIRKISIFKYRSSGDRFRRFEDWDKVNIVFGALSFLGFWLCFLDTATTRESRGGPPASSFRYRKYF